VVNLAGVRGRRSILPREICGVVSNSGLSDPQGSKIAAQKSAEGIVGGCLSNRRRPERWKRQVGGAFSHWPSGSRCGGSQYRRRRAACDCSAFRRCSTVSSSRGAAGAATRVGPDVLGRELRLPAWALRASSGRQGAGALAQMVEELTRYLTGWRGYFGFCQTPSKVAPSWSGKT
jgi:hypothetical protein